MRNFIRHTAGWVDCQSLLKTSVTRLQYRLGHLLFPCSPTTMCTGLINHIAGYSTVTQMGYNDTSVDKHACM